MLASAAGDSLDIGLGASAGLASADMAGAGADSSLLLHPTAANNSGMVTRARSLRMVTSVILS